MTSSYEAIVIGASAGCVETLSKILPRLPADYPLPIMIVVHVPPNKDSVMAELMSSTCQMKVCEANDKEPIKPGHVYFSPPNYHMLAEYNDFISLSNEEEVLFSRPSIDVLFESAADAYGDSVIGIVLTGANNDGASGLKCISERGGLCIVQDPKTAYAAAMPESALLSCPNAKCLTIEEITETLIQIGESRAKFLASRPKEPEKILVVDDDTLSAQTVGWMLEVLGHKPMIAHTGKEAMDIARKEKPKVVFLDITLPDMSGFEICRNLKSDPHLEGMFIVAQTGWSDERDKEKALSDGFDDYLIKPVSMDSYRALLENMLTAV